MAEGLREDHTSQEILAMRNKEPRIMAAICTFSITVREMDCHYKHTERDTEMDQGPVLYVKM